MSFAINPSMNHIDIPESFVSELYRSSAEVLLSDARFHGHTCEAFICIAKIEKDVKAYVALLETEMKTVFVYTSDRVASEPADYPGVYAEADAFVKKLGFVMEPVNLAFSPAMREVIIKGFRVMRPPPIKKPPLRQTKSAPLAEPRKLRVTPLPPPTAHVLPEESGDQAIELESLQRELASAQAAIAQITREKVLLEQSAAMQIASLKASCVQAVEAKEKAAEMFAAEMEKLRQEVSNGASRTDDNESSLLRAELQAVLETAKAAEKHHQEEITAGKAAERHLQKELDVAKAAERHLLEEQDAAKVADAHLQKERNDAKAAEKHLQEELDTSRLAEAHLREVINTAKTAENRLREELETLVDKVGKLENAKLVLEQQLATTADTSAESLRLLAAEKEALLSRIAIEEKAANDVADKIATLKLMETSFKEGQQREEELCRNRDQLQNLLDVQMIELQTYKEKAVRTEEFKLKISSLERELAAAKAEMDLAGSSVAMHTSLAAQLKQLQLEKESVETEYVRFVNESREKELEILDSLAVAENEIERLSREAEIQAQVAALEHQALRAELRKLVVGGSPAITTTNADTAATVTDTVKTAVRTVPDYVHTAASEQLPVDAPLPLDPPVPSAAKQKESLPLDKAAGEPDRPITPDMSILSGLMNEFGSFRGSSGYASTEFCIDPARNTVTYKDPEEIVALIYSVNTVQAVPDNSSIQRCKGYVVATKNDVHYNVYVAWYLTESKRVVICSPQRQPADSEECVRILQDAISYFEIVGFMMEIEELGNSVSSYNQALQKAPVVTRTALV